MRWNSAPAALPSIHVSGSGKRLMIRITLTPSQVGQ
jgi:hypothetical protein